MLKRSMPVFLQFLFDLCKNQPKVKAKKPVFISRVRTIDVNSDLFVKAVSQFAQEYKVIPPG